MTGPGGGGTAKVDELMALCDRLEASLATGDETRRHFLDALLHEALDSNERDSITAVSNEEKVQHA